MRARLTDAELAAIVALVKERGPVRVLVNAGGEAYPPAKALRIYFAEPAVVYVRNDGWTLGAPAALAEAAYRTWSDSWAARIDMPAGDVTRLD